MDECYRQTTSSAVVGPNPILMHLAIEMAESSMPQTSKEIVRICNLPDRSLLGRFMDENSHLIYIGAGLKGKGKKLVLTYYLHHWLHGFFDLNHSQSLYLSSLVITKCQWAIERFIEPKGFYMLSSFFQSKLNFGHGGEIPTASHLLEHVKNVSDRNELLLFLKYLSKVHWLDIYNRGQDQRCVTNGILH